MEEGYILLHRKIVNWEWFNDTNTFIVFIHCLLRANWRDGRFKGVEIKRGQFVTSLPKLAEETKLSIQQVRTSLSHLKSTGEITDTVTSKYRIITISKYDEYQCPNSQLTANQQATNRQLTAIEESNKERNISISSSKDSDIDCQTETVRPPEKHSENIKRIVEAWNTLADCGVPPVSKISTDSKRYKALVARLNQYSVDDILKAVTEVRKSQFLQGHNNRGWVITFDWFVKPSNLPKVLEGNYNKTKGETRDFSWLDA